jgi:hypothetical protein
LRGVGVLPLQQGYSSQTPSQRRLIPTPRSPHAAFIFIDLIIDFLNPHFRLINFPPGTFHAILFACRMVEHI